MSAAYVTKALVRRDRTGEVNAPPQGSHMPVRLAGHEETLRARVDHISNSTLVEMVEWAVTALGVSVSVRTMWK